ncbi:hypothetical protein G3567_12485 [Psychroflexus sp. YR1-1]|uniref:Lipoprotein n=1 Tax=Psychroflexus aurantiacus TaxID=2709310 RepID=A0A6B3R795_9FLAO|nr:hypothetical protein [Psychroflexus aurantiacus]NEV94957.1 hypothetical protein [Psychroflexus aurantiacus]
MKYVILIITGLLISSCVQKQESKMITQKITKPIVLEAESIFGKVEDEVDDKVGMNFNDLQNKVFKIGSENYYTGECAFYFECDCCSGELIFNQDSTFYYIDKCGSDESVRKGNFNFENNVFVLEYGAESVAKRYNWEREVDTTAVEYFITDTILKSVTIEYTASLCDSKIMLEDKKHGQYAIEQSSDCNKALKYLEEEKYIDRIKNLEQ